LVSKTVGKSIIYKVNLENDFARQLILFLLNDEANDFQRWKEEFAGAYKNSKIVLIYGSTVKNYELSRDIDIMIVAKEEEIKKIDAFLLSKQEILPKKIHAIKLTKQDFVNNIKKKSKIFVDIIKNAVVLNGQEEYLEVIKNVTVL
jgi:hypothetical protein